MRSISLLAFMAALAAAPADAQSTILPAEAWPDGGPNAQASRRPMGPNAVAAQRPAGQNVATSRTSKRINEQSYFPSCAQAGAVRAVPIRRGEPGYGRHLDREGDGVACE